jgi:hypothetical protein
VREATRELVMRAVRELNYTPNAAARSVELLLRSIRQRKGGDARVVSDHVMAHALIKRDSVAAPRKG